MQKRRNIQTIQELPEIALFIWKWLTDHRQHHTHEFIAESCHMHRNTLEFNLYYLEKLNLVGHTPGKMRSTYVKQSYYQYYP